MVRDVSGLSDEDRKVVEFMEKNYPQYRDNLALGRLLYAKHMGRVARSVGGEYVRYKVRDLSPSLVGANVEVLGLLGHVETYDFKVCPVCRKKDCICKSPVDESKYLDMVRLRMIVGDDTGNVDVLMFAKPSEMNGSSLEVGREVVVRGRLKFMYDKEDSNRIEILASSISSVDKSQGSDVDRGLEIVLDFVRKAKKVRVDIVSKMCEKHGVRFDEVAKNFKVDGDYVIYVER